MTAVAYKAAMTALASTVWIHCTITFRQRKKVCSPHRGR